MQSCLSKRAFPPRLTKGKNVHGGALEYRKQR